MRHSTDTRTDVAGAGDDWTLADLKELGRRSGREVGRHRLPEPRAVWRTPEEMVDGGLPDGAAPAEPAPRPALAEPAALTDPVDPGDLAGPTSPAEWPESTPDEWDRVVAAEAADITDQLARLFDEESEADEIEAERISAEETYPASGHAGQDVADDASGDPAGTGRHPHSARTRRTGRLRKPMLGALAVVICLLTAGAGTVAALAKTVTISVDGEDVRVTTLAGSVSGALQSAGIAVEQYDSLAPAGTAAIADGSRITLLRARPVTLSIDGHERQIWTTARTVDEALAELGVDPAGYQLSADRSRPIPLTGIDLSGTKLHTVTVAVGGAASVTAVTTAGTVGDFLDERGIVLRSRDTVDPAVSTAISDGQTITVTRTTVARQTTQEELRQPADKEVENPELDEGTSKVTREGTPGLREITWEITLVDGVETDRVEVDRETVRKPKATVVEIGTKPVWSVPWDEMAFCESTNRWDLNHRNHTFGGLQFLTSTWLRYGGDDFAPRADLATKEEQIIVAERLYAVEGLAPWHCARLLGWGFGTYSG